MAERDHAVVTWVIPSLMSAILAVVGWMALSINRLSESLAVMVYRVESQAGEMRESERRIRFLENYAVMRKKLESLP